MKNKGVRGIDFQALRTGFESVEGTPLTDETDLSLHASRLSRLDRLSPEALAELRASAFRRADSDEQITANPNRRPSTPSELISRIGLNIKDAREHARTDLDLAA